MPQPLWGVADLHAHPASHLAFGASPKGGDGIFWGSPGLALSDVTAASLASDLRGCDGHVHSGLTDPVQKKTREAILAQLSELTGCVHGKHGWPSFEDWPKATDLFHEQMHVAWLRRAYDGGLRFLVASVTESQVLTMLWQRSMGAPCPAPDKAKEIASARAQLRFVKELAAKNSAWMKVVLDADDARATIETNRLAVVLGLEMDSLTADDILDLVATEGVRQVVPIHLANNRFGGVAVYADLFNSANEYLTGQFFEVHEDGALEFRLARPQRLHYVSGDLAAGGNVALHGAMEPLDVGDDELQRLQYGSDPAAGHRNRRGLCEAEFLRLLKAGLMVDLAHMSQEAQDDALAVAARHDFPLMNSHSGFRQGRGDSERSMREQDGPRLAGLGGMLGLGSDLGDDGKLLRQEAGEPFERLTSARQGFVVSLAEPLPLPPGLPASRLRVTLETGDGALGGCCQNAFATVETRGGFVHERELNQQGAAWAARSSHEVELLLPPELTVADLASFGLRTRFFGGNPKNAWDVRRLQVDVLADGAPPRRLLERGGAPWRRFSGAEEAWSTPLGAPGAVSPAAAVTCVRVRVRTGASALREGTAARVEVALRNGHVCAAPLAEGTGCPAGGSCGAVVVVPDGTTRADLASAVVLADLHGGDAWDVAEVRFDAVSDPVTRWFELYKDTLQTMGGGGVAFGTDGNGFASQVPFSARAVPYPFQYPQDVAGGTAAQRVWLDKLEVGARKFDFARDGMATYGMLPDFLYALCQRAATAEDKAKLGKLFQSAEAAVALWKKAEEKGKLVP